MRTTRLLDALLLILTFTLGVTIYLMKSGLQSPRFTRVSPAQPERAVAAKVAAPAVAAEPTLLKSSVVKAPSASKPKVAVVPGSLKIRGKRLIVGFALRNLAAQPVAGHTHGVAIFVDGEGHETAVKSLERLSFRMDSLTEKVLVFAAPTAPGSTLRDVRLVVESNDGSAPVNALISQDMAAGEGRLKVRSF